MQELLFGRRKAQSNLHTEIVEDNTQQEEKRHNRHDSVEILETPSSSDCLEDGAVAITELEDKATAKADKELQRDELRSSNSPAHPILGSERRASRNQGPRNTSQAAHQISEGQVKETNKSSIIVGGISFLGVYEQRETPHGPEYRCLVETWLRPQDGVPQEQIQEYDDEMTLIRRRQTLRKRQRSFDGEDADGRMVKKIRRWKERSQ